jgi:hypothetical protein
MWSSFMLCRRSHHFGLRYQFRTALTIVRLDAPRCLLLLPDADEIDDDGDNSNNDDDGGGAVRRVLKMTANDADDEYDTRDSGSSESGERAAWSVALGARDVVVQSKRSSTPSGTVRCVVACVLASLLDALTMQRCAERRVRICESRTTACRRAAGASCRGACVERVRCWTVCGHA